jgi:hypothetical protein
VDYVAESEPPVPDAPGWFPRWVLAGYGVALAAAGLLAVEQAALPSPLRALGVSSFVLGAGCLWLAVRQRPAPRSHRPEAAELEPPVAEPTTDQGEPAEDAPAEETAAVSPRSAPDDVDALDPTAEAARLERLEADLADERARVDRVTAELAALRRVVVEQRQKSNSNS